MDLKRVMVAVRGGLKSKATLKWVLDHSVSEKDVVVLLHVRPIVRMIPTPMGDFRSIAELDDRIVADYLQTIELKTNQMFSKYKKICDVYRVVTEFEVAEHDSVGEALVEQISRLEITMLVMGAAPLCFLLRKCMGGPRMFEHVARNAPNYCNVLVISNRSLFSVQSSTAPPPPPSLPPAPAPPRPHSEIRPGARYGEIEEEWNGDGDLTHRTSRLPRQQHPTRPAECGGEISEEWSGNGSVTQRTPVHHSSIPPQTLARTIEIFFPSVQPFKDQNGQRFWTAVDQLPPDQVSFSSFTGIVETTSGHGMTEEDVASSYSSPEPATRLSPRDIRRLGRVPSSPLIDMPNSWSDISTGSVRSYQGPRVERPQELEMLRKRSEDALRRLEKAQEDVKFQAQERQKAEMDAAVIAMKVKEFERAKEEQSRKLVQAEEAKELAERRITEERRKRMEIQQAVEAARTEMKEERRRRMQAEAQSREHVEAWKAAADALKRAKQRYREYTFAELAAATNNFSVDNLLGEGTYGTVFKGTLQNVSVAIKVLRDNVFQWESKLEREVELLGRIHHPHVLLLLGCCTQNGCLVFEYMANRRLEDQLVRNDSTRPALPWHARFRILAEVATALLFLHSTKPEPIVHRDLKPGNIFLDQNYVSKVGDVGLARLIPPRSADRHTFYARDTTPLGTLAYMDPEYQQTGVVSPKSDIYALGIVILQLLTGKPPLGVIKLMKEALESRTFSDVLDQSAGKWPVEEAKQLAMMALQCAQLLRKDRPDLEKAVLPCLETMRAIAAVGASRSRLEDAVPAMFLCPITQEVMENPVIAADGYTYEMQEIFRWLAANDTSPMTNLRMEHKNLTPNYTLNSAIWEWKDSQQ